MSHEHEHEHLNLKEPLPKNTHFFGILEKWGGGFRSNTNDLRHFCSPNVVKFWVEMVQLTYSKVFWSPFVQIFGALGSDQKVIKSYKFLGSGVMVCRVLNILKVNFKKRVFFLDFHSMFSTLIFPN